MRFSVQYCQPAKFNDFKHIENFCGYLFNMKPHQYNDETKNNFYIDVENGKFIDVKAKIEAKYPQNFNDKQFREIEFKKLTKKVQSFGANNVLNDIFYISGNGENGNGDIDIEKFTEIIVNTLPLIFKFESGEVKKLNKQILYITAHLNQDSPPHLHRIFAV